MEALGLEFSQVGFAPAMIVLDGVGAGVPLTKALDRAGRRQPGPLGAERGSRAIAAGLHPLYFGLNRSAERCYAVARQCRLLY